jgi:hypothetical protein
MSRAWSLLLGIVFLGFAAYTTQRALEFRRTGVVVTGEVIAVDKQLTMEDGALSYSERPRVRYTPNGSRRPLTMTFNWASPIFADHQPGDAVRVRYLPGNPADAREDSALLDWLWPVALVLLGIGGFTNTLRSGPAEYVIWRSSDD